MKPSKVELERLYKKELKTTRQIASIYDVNKSTILDWMKSYGIKRRPPGNRVVYRGGNIPSPETLYQLIHIEKQTYAEIAPEFKCDPSMIGCWLDKYGIARPGQRRFLEAQQEAIDKLPQETLEFLYTEQGLSLEQIGNMYNLTESRVIWLCEKHGIQRKPSGWNSGEFLCLDGDVVKSSYEFRVDNWLYGHKVEHIYEPRLPFDRRYKADFLANGWYIEIWGVVNSKIYKKRREKKVTLYKANNIPLIEIPVHAFDTQHHDQWKRALKKCFQKVHFILIQR